MFCVIFQSTTKVNKLVSIRVKYHIFLIFSRGKTYPSVWMILMNFSEHSFRIGYFYLQPFFFSWSFPFFCRNNQHFDKTFGHVNTIRSFAPDLSALYFFDFRDCLMKPHWFFAKVESSSFPKNTKFFTATNLLMSGFVLCERFWGEDFVEGITFSYDRNYFACLSAVILISVLNWWRKMVLIQPRS